MTRGWIHAVFAAALAAASVAGACSTDTGGVAGNGARAGSGGGAATGGNGASAGSGGGLFDVSTSDVSSYTLTPENPTITIQSGQPIPTLQFEVLSGSAPVSALWLVDRGELGSIDAQGLFTPTGNLAGQATVEATVGTEKLTTTVTVVIEAEQNGATATDAGPGSGGWGGVGGEGLGPAIDAALRALLEGTPSSDAELGFLYPYDRTVFPLGILPPLLQWKAGAGAVADGIYLHLTTTNYDYKGFFGRPTPLAAGTPFVRHPIPRDVWDAATHSAAGGQLKVELVVAAGGTAYGPITQTYEIARGRLKGTVYYQSYGTKLAKNYAGALGGDGMFGGATLAIKPGADEPTLVAGTTGDHSACRVCHSVSADGTRMIVQHGDNYQMSSSYDLNGGYAESPYAASTSGQLGWIGMTPDGALGLGNSVPIPGGANTANSQLYDMTTGAVVATSGLTNFVTQAGFPAFSPDGTKVAFNFFSGPGDATVGAGDGTKLVVMDFDRSTSTFSNPQLLHQDTNRPCWPSFLPTGSSLVYELELPGAAESFATRDGGRGELWWVDLGSGTAHVLANANGTGHAPTGANNHDNDPGLNYEPTVSPIPSGGYAWVVFMSRRMYGNVATIDPWWSDPRFHDISQTPTTKKLWVAAIDLNAQPGTDPSHPAFYLPGQEILAGNSRGYWVVDPCKPDGSSCSSGDECCGGFCQQDPTSGELTCGNKTNECSNEFDRCTTNADCCDPTLECINEVCSLVVPQ